MTAVETETRVTLERAFQATLEVGDGRTLDTLIVPYNVEATVSDPPDWQPYQERFAAGAFERQVGAPGRVKVWLNFEHEQGLRGIVGHGVELSEHTDGLHGSFRVHDNTDGDKALHMIRDGLLTGLSMEFASLRSRVVGGVVERLRAHIDKVSLCRFPAYQGAQVLEVREQPIEITTETVTGSQAVVVSASPLVVPGPVPLPSELAERLTALSLEPLRRLVTTSKAWDGSPARFTDDQYARSCLIAGDTPALPVLEPDGTLNRNALSPAAATLVRGSVRHTGQAEKATAARRLIRYYSAAGIEPPTGLVALGRS